jgi:hypothetical protein
MFDPAEKAFIGQAVMQGVETLGEVTQSAGAGMQVYPLKESCR